jgi:hypothetical protein
LLGTNSPSPGCDARPRPGGYSPRCFGGSPSEQLPCSGQGISTPATGEAIIERITFDEEGRVVQEASNPNVLGELQQLTTSEYDAQRRLLEKTITEPSVGFVQVNTHEYDQDGKLTAVTSERNGQVVAIERFFYDDNGLLRREEVTFLPEEETFVVTFSYQFPPECSM